MTIKNKELIKSMVFASVFMLAYLGIVSILPSPFVQIFTIVTLTSGTVYLWTKVID